MHLPSPNTSPPPPAPQHHHRTPTLTMDSDNDTPAPAPAQKKASGFAGREDCWSADATETLIEAWGERYLDLNRGCLRQKHWQEVADAVNSGHSRRTDVQCKNRIDTLKKKYKIEKARASNPAAGSPWPFFSRLDVLLAPAYDSSPATPAGAPRRKPSPPPFLSLSSPVPVGRRSSTLKRPAPAPEPAGRSFSAFAEAVAAMEEREEEEERARERPRPRPRAGGGGSSEGAAAGGVRLGEVARAIERFGEMYERVERSKQRQLVELERQRMQFAKDLECHRMQLFMETQLHLQRIKRSKQRSSAAAAANAAPTVAADNYA